MATPEIVPSNSIGFGYRVVLQNFTTDTSDSNAYCLSAACQSSCRTCCKICKAILPITGTTHTLLNRAGPSRAAASQEMDAPIKMLNTPTRAMTSAQAKYCCSDCLYRNANSSGAAASVACMLPYI